MSWTEALTIQQLHLFYLFPLLNQVETVQIIHTIQRNTWKQSRVYNPSYNKRKQQRSTFCSAFLQRCYTRCCKHLTLCNSTRYSTVETEVVFCVTFKPHHAIFTTLQEQLVYNEGGRYRLRGCGVDFGTVILKEQEIWHLNTYKHASSHVYTLPLHSM